jgi:hypothetical protein
MFVRVGVSVCARECGNACVFVDLVAHINELIVFHQHNITATKPSTRSTTRLLLGMYHNPSVLRKATC